MRDKLAGHSRDHIDVSVKFDGAPAIIAGIDPSDGKFFVAKKSVFNKSPKVYKTQADIDADVSGDLAYKMSLALQHLPALGIKGVVQGDFLFAARDLKAVKFDGQRYLTFHPNTIVYAVPMGSALEKTIRQAKIGIVWHTTYSGRSFDTMSASFGKPIAAGLNHSKDVWSTDAVFRDVSGSAVFTQAETATITSYLSQAGKIFNTINGRVMDAVADNDLLTTRIGVFINSHVRAGQPITNIKTFVSQMVKYIFDFVAQEIDTKKTERGKQAAKQRTDPILKLLGAHRGDLVKMFQIYALLLNAKQMIVDKLNNGSHLNTLLLTDNGYRTTAPEGYVAIDHLTDNAVKLVDRLQFSKANFDPSVRKGWQR